MYKQVGVCGICKKPVKTVKAWLRPGENMPELIFSCSCQGNQETEVLTGANTDPQNPSTAGMNKPND